MAKRRHAHEPRTPQPTEPPSEYEQARREAAELLGIDPEKHSAGDGLHLDLAVILRRVIDGAAEDLFAGNQVDSGKLVTAVERLITLLPARKLAQPQRPDPRVLMLAELEEMARRGELFDQQREASQVEVLSQRIAELEAENAKLRGERCGDDIEAIAAEVGALERRVADLRENEEQVPRELSGEVIPAGEIADNDRNAQPQSRGPFDHWEAHQWHDRG